MQVQQLCHILTELPQVCSVAGIAVRHFQDSADITLWIDLMRDAFASADPPMRTWSKADFEKQIMGQASWSPHNLFLACDSEHRLVGSVALHFRHRDEKSIPALHWLAVRPAWRRRGVARLLVAHLESACWQKGLREVHLETHSGWREAAYFYASIGYRPTHQVTERPSSRTDPDWSNRIASG